MFDLIIRNGLVVDGSGSAGYRADVGIRGDKIEAIGDLSDQEAAVSIDAAGKVVSPGFIDMHSHADMTLPVAPEAESLIHQGITTVVTGHCGLSPAPLGEATRKEVEAMMSDPTIQLPFEKWSTFESFMEFLESAHTSTNVAALVGQGMIRSVVMGYSADRPSEEQMDQMQQETELAMEAGAFGVSTGLIYPPGSYASTDELIEVTRPVGERNGIYFSHIRGEGDTLLEAISEAIEIGRKSGASVHISHYKAAGANNWFKAAEGIELIEQARAEGVDVTADMYPYLAGSTSLVFLLPEWAHEGGKDAILSRLQDQAVREKMLQSMQAEGFFRAVEWSSILISDSRNKAYIGEYISDLAEAAEKTPFEWVFDALLETECEIGMILFMMSEENVRMQLPQPFMMIGTDGVGLATSGPLAAGLPHPRNFGTFPRVLGQYVREEKIMSLETAVWKMSGFPAQRLGIKDRGLVKEGFLADVVVFDPATIADCASYTQPFQYPAGIEQVLVNGQPVIRDGASAGVRPGRVLRRK